MDYRLKIKELKGLGHKRRHIKEKLGLSDSQYSYYTLSEERTTKIKLCQQDRKRKLSLLPYAKLQARVERLIYSYKPKVKYSYQDFVAKFGPSPKCPLTGSIIDYDDPKSYHIDHIIPLKHGGSSEFDNLQFLSPEANRLKSGYMLEYFVSLCDKIVKNYKINYLKEIPVE